MTDIEAIRQRHEERMKNSAAAMVVHQPTAQVCADVEALLAEVERLNAPTLHRDDPNLHGHTDCDGEMVASEMRCMKCGDFV